MAEDDIDFVAVAYRDEGRWEVAEVSPALGEDLDALLPILQRFPSDVGVLGLVSVSDEFFVIVRSSGDEVRLLLSDATMADLWPLATGVAEALDLPEVTDEDEPAPAGDLTILADLGLSSAEMELLCSDDDLYPDDVLSDVAEKLGFGEAFEAIVG